MNLSSLLLPVHCTRGYRQSLPLLLTVPPRLSPCCRTLRPCFSSRPQYLLMLSREDDPDNLESYTVYSVKKCTMCRFQVTENCEWSIGVGRNPLPSTRCCLRLWLKRKQMLDTNQLLPSPGTHVDIWSIEANLVVFTSKRLQRKLRGKDDHFIICIYFLSSFLHFFVF